MTVIDMLFFKTLHLCSNALALERGKSQAIFCTDAYSTLREGLDLVQRTQVKTEREEQQIFLSMILVGPLKHACGTQNNSSIIFFLYK